jgi:phosphopantetheine--protein transferase-like protein
LSDADRLLLESQDLHLWLCSRDRIDSSDSFKRTVLSHYTGVLPQDLQFAEGEHGKPELVDAALQFNLSHSGDWLACAVTAGTPVGVDLERCKPERASVKVARRFFREEEAVLLENSSGASMAERFFDFWTLKEAAVKARGGALAPGLSAHGFSVDFNGADNEAGRITATASDKARYVLLDPVVGYRVALCWMGAAELLPRLGLYELHDSGRVAPVKAHLRASSVTA